MVSFQDFIRYNHQKIAFYPKKTGDLWRLKHLGESKNQADLFRIHLGQILKREHPLTILAEQINCHVFGQEFGFLYVENIGCPGRPIRLVVGLHYLRYAYHKKTIPKMRMIGKNN